MRENALGTETSGQISCRERSEVAERADPESHQHIDQLGAVEGGDRQRGEEAGGAARLHEQTDTGLSDHLTIEQLLGMCFQPAGRATPGRQASSEGTIGHPHPNTCPGWDGIGHQLVGTLHDRGFTTEVPGRPTSREQALTWSDDLHSRGELLERHENRLVRSGLDDLVLVDDHEIGGSALGFPPPQPCLDTSGPSAGDVATTRLATTTAVGSPRSTPAATTGQSRHRTTTQRSGCDVDIVLELDPAASSTRWWSGTAVSSTSSTTRPCWSGSQSVLCRGRAALRRPRTSSSTRRACRWP